MLTSTLHRPGDLAARYGGEEFAVILPDTSLDGAAAMAESIRMAVRGLAMTHSGVPVGLVTVSLGVAACEAGCAMVKMEALVAEADAALYAAKAAGRDRVMVGRPDGAADVVSPAAFTGSGI